MFLGEHRLLAACTSACLHKCLHTWLMVSGERTCVILFEEYVLFSGNDSNINEIFTLNSSKLNFFPLLFLISCFHSHPSLDNTPSFPSHQSQMQKSPLTLPNQVLTPEKKFWSDFLVWPGPYTDFKMFHITLACKGVYAHKLVWACKGFYHETSL